MHACRLQRGFVRRGLRERVHSCGLSAHARDGVGRAHGCAPPARTCQRACDKRMGREKRCCRRAHGRTSWRFVRTFGPCPYSRGTACARRVRVDQAAAVHVDTEHARATGAVILIARSWGRGSAWADGQQCAYGTHPHPLSQRNLKHLLLFCYLTRVSL